MFNWLTKFRLRVFAVGRQKFSYARQPVVLDIYKQDLVNPSQQQKLFNSNQDDLLDKPEKKFPIR